MSAFSAFPRPLAVAACCLAVLGGLWLGTPGPVAQEVSGKPLLENAEAWYQRGFTLQKAYRTREALAAYRRALVLDPGHGATHYEIGWSYWILGQWARVVRHWEIALAAGAGVPELPDFLADARLRMEGKGLPVVRVPIGTRAEGGGLSLELAARFQRYERYPDHPEDRFDRHVFSPKSVQPAPDGSKVFVQALEGGATLIYRPGALAPGRAIRHRFGEAAAGLFDPEETAAFAPRFRAGGSPEAVNRYQGKPVEGVFTHGGRYLWVSHYRRSYDKLGILPSSVAVIDTRREAIVRVMHTGPIPKSLAASPDGRWLAVMHWGDNTVGLIDVSGDDPGDFRHAGEIVVGRRLPLDLKGKVNRDRYCGFCLRGAVFSTDSRRLLVARMGGGGIAVLDVPGRRHVGSVFGMRPTPRHLVLSPDGGTLYLSSNRAGTVSAYRTDALIAAAEAGRKRLPPLREAETGPGTRSIALSPDGRTLYAAVFKGSKVVALDTETFTQRLEIAADSYPVGLAVTPDGGWLWVTAQGYQLRGGNSVMVYRVRGR